jgi:hypothetical protein
MANRFFRTSTFLHRGLGRGREFSGKLSHYNVCAPCIRRHMQHELARCMPREPIAVPARLRSKFPRDFDQSSRVFKLSCRCNGQSKFLRFCCNVCFLAFTTRIFIPIVIAGRRPGALANVMNRCSERTVHNKANVLFSSPRRLIIVLFIVRTTQYFKVLCRTHSGIA